MTAVTLRTPLVDLLTQGALFSRTPGPRRSRVGAAIEKNLSSRIISNGSFSALLGLKDHLDHVPQLTLRFGVKFGGGYELEGIVL